MPTPEARRERLARTIVICGTAMVIVGLLLFVAMNRTGNVYDELNRVQSQLYERCMARVEYDAASQAARRTQREYWLSYIAQEELNPVTDENLRRARVESAREMIKSFDDVLRQTPSTDCSVYKPR